VAKFENLEDFYKSLPEDQATAIRRFVDHVASAYPQFEMVLAWNQPMFRVGTKYILGFMPTKNYINLATVSPDVIVSLGPALEDYRHGGRTISLPFDWQIDTALIAQIVELRLVELGLAR
jgi:uncharacterized protein